MIWEVCWEGLGTLSFELSLFHGHGLLARVRGDLKGLFTLRWRSAPVSQELEPKTCLFEARDGMPEKMKRPLFILFTVR